MAHIQCQDDSTGGFARLSKALAPEPGRHKAWVRRLTLRRYEAGGSSRDCQVPQGEECYFCWDDRRRVNKGMSQAEVNDKLKSDKKFKDKHTGSRAERVQGARKPGQDRLEATTVVGEEGAFRQEFDEGLFYTIDNWLALHASGRPFSGMRAKVEYVESQGERVVKDPRGRAHLKLV